MFAFELRVPRPTGSSLRIASRCHGASRRRDAGYYRAMLRGRSSLEVLGRVNTHNGIS